MHWRRPGGEAGSRLAGYPMTTKVNGWLAAPGALLGVAYGGRCWDCGRRWVRSGFVVVDDELTTDFDGRVFEAVTGPSWLFGP
jgi:hypothetical protein